MSVSYNFYQRVAIGVTTGLFALTTFVVYMRLYIRCILLKAGSAGWDDLTVFIAWVSRATHKEHLTPNEDARKACSSLLTWVITTDHGPRGIHSYVFRYASLLGGGEGEV